jgi:2',3'-cyclic-nucleotide 2'-phosphodiesterase (5'-nucleotidase family)
MKRQILSLILATGLAGCGSSSSPFVHVSTPQAPFRLTVLHHNDANSALLNAGPGLEDFGGAARFATLAGELGAGQPATVLLSAGDNLAAGSIFEASMRRGVPYYDSLAMELIGFEASAIGNQELDYGPDVLAELLASFARNVPFLGANLDVSAESGLAALQAQGRLAASTVLQRQGRAIGVIGLTTPRASFIASPRGVVIDPDVVAVVRQQVEALSAQGVNIIILLSHLETLAENQALLSELEGVDLVIAATPFEVLASTGTPLVPGDEALVVGDYPAIYTDAQGSRVPVVSTAGNYKYVGRLTAVFDDSGNLIATEDAAPVRVAGGAQPDAVGPDPAVLELVTEPLSQALAARAATVVASSQVSLDATAASMLHGETNVGNLVADALLARGRALAPGFNVPLPRIALVNSGGIPADRLYPVGSLTELDLNNLLPFSSFLTIVESIPPSQLKELLENSVSRVENNDGRFSQVAGFRFTWDPNGTAQQLDEQGNVLVPGSRIREVTLDDGTPMVVNGLVQPDAPAIDIATLDFTVRGGDQYPYRGAAYTSLGLTYATALQEFLQQTLGGVISAQDYPAGGDGRITRL